jgi:hypothetical protein
MDYKKKYLKYKTKYVLLQQKGGGIDYQNVDSIIKHIKKLLDKNFVITIDNVEYNIYTNYYRAVCIQNLIDHNEATQNNKICIGTKKDNDIWDMGRSHGKQNTMYIDDIKLNNFLGLENTLWRYILDYIILKQELDEKNKSNKSKLSVLPECKSSPFYSCYLKDANLKKVEELVRSKKLELETEELGKKLIETIRVVIVKYLSENKYMDTEPLNVSIDNYKLLFSPNGKNYLSDGNISLLKKNDQTILFKTVYAYGRQYARNITLRKDITKPQIEELDLIFKKFL